MRLQQWLSQVVWLVAIAVSALAVPALADDCPELVGRWPYGPAYAIAVSGQYAYVGSGSALIVADVSDPSTPHEVGAIALPSYAGGVAIAGGYAYVADGDAGLPAIDVTTPTAPIEIGFIDTPGWAVDVAVSGGYAYVADGRAGLRVIDVSTPSAPLEVGFTRSRSWVRKPESSALTA